MQPCLALSRWTRHGKAVYEFVIQASRVRCIRQSVTGLVVAAPDLSENCQLWCYLVVAQPPCPSYLLGPCYAVPYTR